MVALPSWKRIIILWVIFLAVVALCWRPLFGKTQDTPLPPDPENIHHYGCRADLETDKAQQQWWNTYVWVEYRDNRPRWEKIFAKHYPNERSKALKDCDLWLSRVAPIRRVKK